MRNILIVLVLLLSSVKTFSQTNEMKQHVIIKFLPLAMFDIDNTFQFGVEVPLKNTRFSIHQEAGYGHSSFSPWHMEEGKRPDRTTIKTRTQLRFYFYEKSTIRAFVAGEYLFKRVVNRDRQWVGQDCINGGCDYFENQNVRFGRFINAGHVKVGWQFHFPRRMILDVYTGFGLRNVEGRILTPGAENARLREDWWLLSRDPVFKDTIPSLAVGFQLGLLLGKLNPVKSVISD